MTVLQRQAIRVDADRSTDASGTTVVYRRRRGRLTCAFVLVTVFGVLAALGQLGGHPLLLAFSGLFVLEQRAGVWMQVVRSCASSLSRRNPGLRCRGATPRHRRVQGRAPGATAGRSGRTLHGRAHPIGMVVVVAPLRSRRRWKPARRAPGRAPTRAAKAGIVAGSPASSRAKASA